MRTRHTWRFVLGASLLVLAVEAVTLVDWRGAKADDLDLLTVGGAAGGEGMPPPNILFLFDSSGSMNKTSSAKSCRAPRNATRTSSSRAPPPTARRCA